MNKTIHYIWLGGKKKPRVVKRCIKSWRKYMPDWTIKEWNEKNLNLDICDFAREAYDSRRYAFAADVFRFEILDKEGGLYFDTDVELFRSLNDLVEKYEAFTGYEYIRVNPGLVLFSSKPKNFFIHKMTEMYKRIHFLENGKMNTRVVGDYLNEFLEKEGFCNEDVFQQVLDFVIFPSTYFCPTDGFGNAINFSEKTYSQHLFAGSWMPWQKRLLVNLKKKLYKIMGKGFIQKIMSCYRFLRK